MRDRKKKSGAFLPSANSHKKKEQNIELVAPLQPIPVLVSLILLSFIGILIYSNSFDCSFHFDDSTSIIKNKAIQNGATWKSVWSYNHNRFWPYYSMAVNYRLGELDVWGYHLFNLLIHLINTCLVYFIVLQLFATPVMKENKLVINKSWIAFGAALFFVTHPLATQSVTYIVQRLASMVALFYLLTLLLYLKGRLTQNSTRYIYYFAATFSAFMTFTSKENGYTLPIAILLSEFCFFQTRKITFSFKDYRIITAISLALGLVGYSLTYFSLSIFNSIPPQHGNSYTITSQNYLFTQFSVMVKYIQLLIFPIRQNLDYDFPISNSLFESRTLFSLLILMALLFLAIMRYNKNRLLSFCIFWFFITLAVESSVVPIADVIFEHRTYLPSLGFVLLFSYLIFQYAGYWSKWAPVIIIALIGFIYAIQAHIRNRVWKDDGTLYRDVIKKAPTKARAWGSLADFYRDNGEESEAMTHYNEAIKLSPRYSIALHNRAGIYVNQNQNDKAISDYTRAIAADNNYFKALYNRGTIYNKINQFDSAISDLNRALQIDSTDAKVYNNRGISYINKGMNLDAIEDFNHALSLDQELGGVYYNRGNAKMKLKKNEEAIIDFTNAIKRASENKFAYYNRGLIYDDLSQYSKAIDDYTQAIAADNNFIQAYVNRGSVYSKLKEWKKAIADFKKALQIDPNFSLAISNLKYVESQSGLK